MGTPPTTRMRMAMAKLRAKESTHRKGCNTLWEQARHGETLACGRSLKTVHFVLAAKGSVRFWATGMYIFLAQ